jgi:uncharacterized protein with PQ loop repeat
MTKYNHRELAIAATILIIASFVVVIYDIHKTKNATRMSYLWLGLIIIGQLLSLVYDILNNMPEAYIPVIFIIIGLLYVLYIKIQYAEEVAIEEDLIKKKILNE